MTKICKHHASHVQAYLKANATHFDVSMCIDPKIADYGNVSSQPTDPIAYKGGTVFATHHLNLNRPSDILFMTEA